MKKQNKKPKFPQNNKQRVFLFVSLLAFILVAGTTLFVLHSVYSSPTLLSAVRQIRQGGANPFAFKAVLGQAIAQETGCANVENGKIVWYPVGSLICVSNWVYRCDSDGWWRGVEDCDPGTCENGNCILPEPEPVTCEDNGVTYQLSDTWCRQESGVWWVYKCYTTGKDKLKKCDHGCQNGECLAAQCKDGARNNKLVSPGSKTCEGSWVYYCDDNGWWQAEENCEPGTCELSGENSAQCKGAVEVKCMDRARNNKQVSPGSTTCESNWVYTCDNNGEWQAEENCDPGTCELSGENSAQCISPEPPETPCKDHLGNTYSEGENWCDLIEGVWWHYMCSENQKEPVQRCVYGCENGRCKEKPEPPPVSGDCQDINDPCGTDGYCKKFRNTQTDVSYWWCAERCTNPNATYCADSPDKPGEELVIKCHDFREPDGSLSYRLKPALRCYLSENLTCEDGQCVPTDLPSWITSDDRQKVVTAHGFILYIDTQAPVTKEHVVSLDSLSASLKQEYITQLDNALEASSDAKNTLDDAGLALLSAGLQDDQVAMELSGLGLGSVALAQDTPDLDSMNSDLENHANNVNNITNNTGAQDAATMVTGFTTTVDGWPSVLIIFANPLKANDVPGLIRDITNYILGIAGSIMLIILIINGIRYMSAGGDERKAENAKKAIRWVLIGIIIILASGIIINSMIWALRGEISPPSL